MAMCATGFDIDDTKLAFLEDTRKKMEKDFKEEVIEMKQTDDEIQPISDDEDDTQGPSIKIEDSQVAPWSDLDVPGYHEQDHSTQRKIRTGRKRPRVSDDHE